MEIKIVKKPLQNSNTKLEDLEHIEFIMENNQLKEITPNWCVRNFMYREGDGGMKLWFKELKRVNPDIIYLYEIKAWKDKVVNGHNKENWIEDIIYSIRTDFKKSSIRTSF
jgi:hypothetical protein